MTQIEKDFQSHARFRLQRRMGEGRFGVTFEAEDLLTRERVILKVLPSGPSPALTHFKRSFHDFACIQHPNLVPLGELQLEGLTWFFTRPFVEGAVFSDYLTTIGAGSASEPLSPEGRMVRVKSILLQIGQALSLIHQNGATHGDLKPSNILVTAHGIAQLVDFGLAVAERDPPPVSPELAVYRRPNRSAGCVPIPADDWYALGILLYGGLWGFQATRALPVAGDGSERPDLTFPPATPDTLIAFCRKLLEPEAVAPNEAEVARALGAGAQPDQGLPGSRTGRENGPSVVLHPNAQGQVLEALDAVRNGASIAVGIEGAGGLGKSALLAALDREIASSHAGVTCIRGELMGEDPRPFVLAEQLLGLLGTAQQLGSQVAALDLAPMEQRALELAFPTQLGVDEGKHPSGLRPAEWPGLRCALLRAFRLLLEARAAGQVLCLLVDNLERGDLDSLSLLTALAEEPCCPVLLVFTHRPTAQPELEGESFNGWVQQLDGKGWEVRRIQLEAPGVASLKRMSAPLLPVEPRAVLSSNIFWKRLGGNPRTVSFLMLALAEGTWDGLYSPGWPLEAAHVDPAGRHLVGPKIYRALLRERIAALGSAEGALLRTLSCTAIPLDRSDLLEAADVASDGLDAIASLQRASLIREWRGRWTLVDPDVSAWVLESLTGLEVQAVHDRLAGIYETDRGCVSLAAALRMKAGQHAQARTLMALAARQAERRLAFEQAVGWYEQWLALIPAATIERAELRRAQGEALLGAGHRMRACGAFLSVARHLGGDEGEALQLRVVLELLRCGRIDDAVANAEALLKASGATMSGSHRQVVGDLVRERFLLRMRGLDFEPMEESHLPARVLQQMNVCWRIGMPLNLIDLARGQVALHRFSRIAVQAGEPLRVGRALAMEASTRVLLGDAMSEMEALFSRAEEIANAAEDVGLTGQIHMYRAISNLAEGGFDEALVECGRAQDCLEVVPDPDGFQPLILKDTRQVALFWLGRWKALRRGFLDDTRGIRGEGDALAHALLLSDFGWITWVMDDDSDALREALDVLLSRWQQKGWGSMHAAVLVGQAFADLYEGCAESALEQLEQGWGELRASGLLHVHAYRFRYSFVRARALLMLAHQAPRGAHTSPIIRRVQREVDRLKRSHPAWVQALSMLLQAGLLQARGREEAGIACLVTAEAALEGAGMAVLAAAARHAHGRAIGGEEGACEMSEAEQVVSQLGVRKPVKLMTVFV